MTHASLTWRSNGHAKTVVGDRGKPSGPSDAMRLLEQPLESGRPPVEGADVAKNLKNHRGEWTNPELRQLKKEVKENTPTRVIAFKHQRTEGAIRQKAFQEGISLKPTNRSPYGTSSKSR